MKKPTETNNISVDLKYKTMKTNSFMEKNDQNAEFSSILETDDNKEFG